MKYPSIIFILGVLMALPTLGGAQQLPTASPFRTDQFLFNPAMTAADRQASVSALHNQQWLGFNDAPSTTSINGQFAWKGQPITLGAFLTNDELLPLTQNTLGITYAYHLGGYGRGASGGNRNFSGPRKRGQLSIGMLVALQQTTLDPSNLLVNDQDDLLLPNGEEAISNPTIGFGVQYATRPGGPGGRSYGYLGFAFQQILSETLAGFARGSDEFGGLLRVSHSNFSIGYHHESDGFILKPSLWVDIAENSPATTQLSFTAERIRSYWAGLTYNINQTATLQLGYILAQPNSSNALRLGVLGSFNLGSTVADRGLGYAAYLGYVFGR